MKFFKLIIFFCLFLQNIDAQDNITISGHVTDKDSGEELIGASIFIQNTSIGVNTNIYGFYSLTIPKGEYVVAVSYIGYSTKLDSFRLDENQNIEFELTAVSSEIQEVLVKANKEDVMLQEAGVGTTKINIKKLETLPVFMGEKDILKSIQLLPGISAVSEGSTGLTVRGAYPAHIYCFFDNRRIRNYQCIHLLYKCCLSLGFFLCTRSY